MPVWIARRAWTVGKASGREQDDRDVARGRLAAKSVQRGQPIHARHHDVEDDHMGRVGRGLLQGVFTVDGGLDLKALQLEVDLDDGQDVRIVVRDEDSLAHLPSIALLSSAAATGGSSAPKMVVPATSTFAPAATAFGAVSSVIPPST